MDIRNLEPKAVWNHFADFCAIPHPSGHEQKLAAFITDSALKLGLTAYTDEAGNVIIKKPASKGCENAPGVILQAHLDMVPVSDPAHPHDFLTDPIKPYIGDDGFVHAEGTTLGADDCIGAATALALLEDPKLKHGPLTAIFTVEEETTMKGAAGLDGRELDGDYLINLDSEENGLLYVGCAGSLDIVLNYKPDMVGSAADKCSALKLKLLDLKGGHSGTDINRGHANAIASLALLLKSLAHYKFGIKDFKGGQARNAIPAWCEAVITLSKDEVQAFKQDLFLAFEQLRGKFKDTEPKMRLEIIEQENTGTETSAKSAASLLGLIGSLKLGPFSMSPIDPSIVQTSCNLGTIRFKDGVFELCMMARSLDEKELSEVAELEGESEFAKSLGEAFSYYKDGSHGAWQSPAENHLISILKKNWKEVTGSDLKVTVLHAGLECGFFVQKAGPNLQLVSIGATIKAPHSPDERVEIYGVGAVYDTVKRTLSELK